MPTLRSYDSEVIRARLMGFIYTVITEPLEIPILQKISDERLRFPGEPPIQVFLVDYVPSVEEHSVRDMVIRQCCDGLVFSWRGEMITVTCDPTDPKNREKAMLHWYD
jgi:hypothetical protein